jgi:hypothetical protein
MSINKILAIRRGILRALSLKQLFAMRSALRRRRLNSLQNGVSGAVTRDQNRQRDGRNREDDRSPRGHLGENIDGSAGAKGGLRALAAKRASQIRALARLQQDNSDQNKTNDDVKNGKQINHWVTFE